MTATSKAGTLLVAVVLVLSACCPVAALGLPSYDAPGVSFTPFVAPSATPRPSASPALTPRPTARPERSPKPTAKPKPTGAIGTATVAFRGVASWYCNKDASRGPLSRCTAGYPGGMFAAVRKGTFATGSRVTVCAGKACIRVRVIDCNCGKNANLIDLYADAFARLAPLSRGAIEVTVSR